jgi:hypothetical protein
VLALCPLEQPSTDLFEGTSLCVDGDPEHVGDGQVLLTVAPRQRFDFPVV